MIIINDPFSCIYTWTMCLMVWYWVIYESNSSTSYFVLFDQIWEMTSMSCFFMTKPSLWFLCLSSPLSLSSSGCGAAHPEPPPPLQRGAAAGQCHTGVSGQRGLPLSLEAGLEGGGQQQLLRGVPQPGGPGGGQPLQLDQHPEPPCRPVEEGGLSELWGQSEWTEPCHSKPGPWPLLSVELQQHFLSGHDAASLIEILMKLHISSAHIFLHVSQLSTLCFSVHVAFLYSSSACSSLCSSLFMLNWILLVSLQEKVFIHQKCGMKIKPSLNKTVDYNESVSLYFYYNIVNECEMRNTFLIISV